MRCSICGLPLRPSQQSEATCASLSCRRLYRLRAPKTYGRRCSYCARPAAPDEDTCEDPRCRSLRAGWIDGRKRETERRTAIDRVGAEQERELRETHGPAVPERLLLARLPANEHTTTPLPDERRAAFEENLKGALDRALEDPDRPFPETPATPARHDALIGAACGACRGSCCRHGGVRAYLYPDHFRRYLRDHPGASREQIVSEYLSRLPAESYHD